MSENLQMQSVIRDLGPLLLGHGSLKMKYLDPVGFTCCLGCSALGLHFYGLFVRLPCPRFGTHEEPIQHGLKFRVS